MRTSRIIVIIAIGVLLILGACASPVATRVTPTPTPTPTVPQTPTPAAPTIPGLAPNEVWIGAEFWPNIIIVPVGTSVTWVNKDGEAHSVTSESRIFNWSLGPGSSFSYTFTAPGTYAYFCEYHHSMSGEIIVK